MKFSGLFANLVWLAVISQYLFSWVLVFTCFSHFDANFKYDLFLLESKVSRLKALVYEMYELPNMTSTFLYSFNVLFFCLSNAALPGSSDLFKVKLH